MESIPVLPVFIRERDIVMSENQSMKPYEMSKLVADCVTFENIEGCQRIGNLWRIYLLSSEARIKILTDGLTVDNQQVTVHASNPYVTGNSDPSKPTVKITVKDIPLSFNNTEIKEMLQDLGAELTGEIRYGLIRDDEGKLTSMKNGDRFVYAYEMKLKQSPLPRKSSCGGFKCRIFHKHQISVDSSAQMCRNCWQTGHWTSRCSNPRCCMLCKSAEHTEGSQQCKETIDNKDKVKSVFGGREPLSAFYQEGFKVFGLEFETVEQAYQYTRAIRSGRLDISAKIKDSHNPYEVKELSKQIKSDMDWDAQKSKVMSEILHSKMNQSLTFVESLKNSGNKLLVSPKIGDLFWGTGVNFEISACTRPESWPGKNVYGSMLMEIRDKIIRENVPGPTEEQVQPPDKPTTRSASKSPGREKIQQFFKKTSKKKHNAP